MIVDYGVCMLVCVCVCMCVCVCVVVCVCVCVFIVTGSLYTPPLHSVPTYVPP